MARTFSLSFAAAVLLGSSAASAQRPCSTDTCVCGAGTAAAVAVIVTATETNTRWEVLETAGDAGTIVPQMIFNTRPAAGDAPGTRALFVVDDGSLRPRFDIDAGTITCPRSEPPFVLTVTDAEEAVTSPDCWATLLDKGFPSEPCPVRRQPWYSCACGAGTGALDAVALLASLWLLRRARRGMATR